MARKTGKVAVRKSGEPQAPSTELTPIGSAFRSLQALHDEIDRLFEDLSFGLPRPLFGRSLFELDPLRRFERALAPAHAITPNVDVTETDTEVTVTAELPGLDEKDIEVVLSENVLTLKGEKKEEQEQREQGYYLTERRYGSFQRSFRLPEGVDRDKVQADFAKGVLTVRIPKTAKAKRAEKKIAIKTK